MPSRKIESFTDLVVWQKSHNLVLEIYRITGKFPADERYGLVQQMRRAAVSIPANIAEGFKRKDKKNKIIFYNIGESSLEELKYYLILSKDLGYIKNTEDLVERCLEVARLIKGLIKSIASEA
jgi:four helix bundle protein